MLVLKRRETERVRLQVGDVIVWVTITEIERGWVRLGFEAPAGVDVRREELLPVAERHYQTTRRKKSGDSP